MARPIHLAFHTFFCVHWFVHCVCVCVCVMWRGPFNTFLCGHCWFDCALIFINCGTWTLQNYLFIFKFPCTEYNFSPNFELKELKRYLWVGRTCGCGNALERKQSSLRGGLTHFANSWFHTTPIQDWILKDEKICWSSRSPLFDMFEVMTFRSNNARVDPI